ncbi:uncharacterized protein TRIVIDRAFT_67441 [Trichoderma virens Gv29-8]|uniref:Alpha/beta hydrolase domain-containing protein n=1 Tax=Hypocrea virens (strain Gv29-8 / FGSC 10586) TaxID=413071 RepID=G9N655_HYPVG|nr:uncharacterized protein TRIVIDRAFT_67441 [Trichoderma virens Gv29-8]EHK18245.1 hypothetical protein TRIVIDRAFT_67441 [Trichoderma virens Gv29-8]
MKPFLLFFGIIPLAFASINDRKDECRLPKVEGPISGGQKGYPFASFYGNISEIGYIEEEFFLTGNAKEYEQIGDLGLDGKWDLKPTKSSYYKTRILVRRPKNHSRFSGVALLEWINVSFGYEVTFGGDAPGIYQNGSVYVLVSAQRVGVSGLDIPNPQGLHQWDPDRYGSLTIPNDTVSYDIYTQVARIIKSPQGQAKVLGGLSPDIVVAVGGSQSGSRVLAYTNGIQPLTNVFDATMPYYLPDKQPPSLLITHPLQSKPRRFRPCELEASYTILFGTRQPDTAYFRYWEVAGASHVNVPLYETLLLTLNRDGVVPPEQLSLNWSQVNWLPVVDAAFRLLPAWIKHHSPPSPMPLIEGFLNGTIPILNRAADGNVIGGVRLPEITVPIAQYVGLVGIGLNGATNAYSEEKLKDLYHTHEDYVKRVVGASIKAYGKGIILDYQVAIEVQRATAAHVPH